MFASLYKYLTNDDNSKKNSNDPIEDLIEDPIPKIILESIKDIFFKDSYGYIHKWTYKTKKLIRILPDSLKNLPNGRILNGFIDVIDGRIVSSDNNKSILRNHGEILKLYDHKTLEIKRIIGTNISEPDSICFSPDGSYFTSGNDNFTITIWNTKTGLPFGFQ